MGSLVNRAKSGKLRLAIEGKQYPRVDQEGLAMVSIATGL